jgi:SAM-dependent methyltransferase
VTREPNREVIADYAGFDFHALWRGRDKTTQIEQELLRLGLGRRRFERVLEVGTGFGRLTPTLRALAAEYVGMDFDLSGLTRARASVQGDQDRKTRWILGNLLHPPFGPASFDAVVMVRVAHHLPHWAGAARALSQLLLPGGRLVVTVTPSRSFGAFVQDLKQVLDGTRLRRWSTFSRGEDVLVKDSPHPVYVGSRGGYRTGLEQAGLRIVAKMGSGLEELAPMAPVAVCVRLAPMAETLPWFPTKWYGADRSGLTGAPLPSLDSIYACPRCRTSVALPDSSEPDPVGCPRCAFPIRSVGGVPDFRYVPEGAVRLGPEPSAI